jgi:hypothetical protein
MKLSNAEIIAVNAFRRDPKAVAIRRIVERIAQAALDEYIVTAPANEQLRVAVVVNNAITKTLFDQPFTK